MSGIAIKDLRAAFVYLVKDQGKSRREVAEFFGVRPNTVCDAVKRFESTGGNKNRSGQGRKRTATDTAHREEVVTMLQANSHTKRRRGVVGSSSRKLARRLGVSETSARRILKRDLKLKPYKKLRRQKLTARDKQQRVRKATALRDRFGRDDQHRQILFTDECRFVIEEGLNSQNDRIWSAEPPLKEVRVVCREQCPNGLMVWGGFGYGVKTPLIIIDAGLRMNATIYRETVLEPLERWAEEVYGKDADGQWTRNWVFQQDGATVHTARANIEWIKDHFPDFIGKDEWPAKSPDLTVPDFYGWGRLKERVNAEAFESVAALREALLAEWDLLDPEEIKRAVDSFPWRLDACIEARGGHFE
jgi:Homeodomain-like domain